MSYPRFLSRNRLHQDNQVPYRPREPWNTEWVDALSKQSIIAGDLRRLEQDSRDAKHLAWYAEQTGLTAEQVRAVLDLFFRYDTWNGPDWYPGGDRER